MEPFIVEKEGKMRVPVQVFASRAIFEKMREDGSLEQAKNVASLPGIVGSSIVMPDAHLGYGFSIGGVAAFDMETGIISPGGIGFDINCGVRLLATDITMQQLEEHKEELLDALFATCPVGVGVDGLRISVEQMHDIMINGAKWAVANGYGNEDDLTRCESQGQLPEADPAAVPERAVHRGKRQLGTVGAGNHFVELQAVEKIFDEDAARAFGLVEGNVVVMIHCGSRGFGHQICTEYIREMEDTQPEIVKDLVDRDLIYAPIGSDIARRYWGAMNAAANFAFCNRHILGHNVRMAFQKIYGDAVRIRTVYDVCHNIAKRERHVIDGNEREVMVHRKGATRAFPKGHADVPMAYADVGQPVIIPGSMGTASYVLVGSGDALSRTFGSTAHGAGRLMSRVKAKRDFPADIVEKELARKGISVRSATKKGISEEAPGAYKDIDAVIAISHDSGIAKRVARLVPLGVIKG